MRKMDGGGTKTDAPQTTTDGQATDTHPGETGGLAIGQPCSAAGAKCMSGFCADGFCCNTACEGACLTCAAAGSVGTCVPADIGTNPRSACTDMGSTTCGTDGLCDGTGSCENYPSGVVCQQAGCSGSMLTFAGRCDGTGAACPTATGQSCAPYVCGATGQCKTTCTVDADCIAPTTCNNGSCGKKPIGASCAMDVDCNSGICAQGACCATTCTGSCKSCGLPGGSAGSCINVPAGMDPLGQCSDSGAMSCKTNGSCDGAGACQNYAAGTVCGTDSCTGGTEMVAGKCDGAGTCAAGSLVACGAYICGTNGDCKTSCGGNADCAAGFVCNGTICGKKPIGVTCGGATECTSGYCEQGLCCNTGCEAACQACNLTATPGTCTPIPIGMDPLNQCADVGSTTPCGTNGSCDGAGKCQLYPSGTVCLAQSCTGSTLSPASRCDGAGKCVAGTNQSCVPYNCGATACLTTCTGNTNCVSPNVCAAMSCGKFPIGAVCAANTDCGSGFCAQGYCCNTACTGTCQSCALTSSLGTCTNVPSGGTDPGARCTNAGAPSCANNGFCDGAGACQKYASGTQCAAASCTGSTFTPPALCNGTGTCTPPTTSPCGAFACDTTNKVCKTTCTAAADCTPPNVCNGGTCSLQPLGTVCTSTAQCASGLCQQGYCCATTCAGGCASCGFATTLGTCTNAATGTDPANACTDGTAAKCGNDGFCDGNGKCRLYAGGTICAPASCPSTTFTPASTCDGAGNCQAVTSTLCTPFACNTTTNACKTTCASTTDCASPNICNTTTMSCGLLSIGATCTTNASCNSGFCAQGVCCNTACTALCNSCSVAGHVGTCVDVTAGVADPTARCTNGGAATCGNNGFCDGNGACQKYASGTQCIAQTCATSTLQPASTCNGTGTCVTPATNSCTPFICGTNACKTTCATSADCISAAYMCSGGSCIQAVNLTVKTETKNASNVDFVYFDIRIINNGTTAVPLSQITVKYWYTWDVSTDAGTQPNETAACTYTLGAAPGNCGNVTTSFGAVSPVHTGADHYFQLGFTTAAGSLAAGATAEIGPGFNKNDFSAFTQTNDYSYNSATAFATTTKVTVYLGGALVYGVEPP